MRVVMRGAGDLATGVALRLLRAGMEVIMLECEKPTAIRRTVAMSEAVYKGEMRVEDKRGLLCQSPAEAAGLGSPTTWSQSLVTFDWSRGGSLT